MTALLSNPVLDELYSVRRVFIGRYNALHKINDGPGMDHYLRKVNALDEAIAAYITVNAVPPEHVEQTMLERAKQLLGIRVPSTTE